MSDVGDVEQTPVTVDEAARQRVEGQLLDAYAEGRLSDDEFDRRIRAAVEASSPDDLHEATRDIPAPGTRTDDPTGGTASPATPSTSATPSNPSTSGTPSTSGIASPASAGSATGSANTNPLALDTDPPDFPAYPYGAGSSPYGSQPGPYAADPPPRVQSSPYGSYGAPGSQPTTDSQLSPYGERVPGRGYPVPVGLGSATSGKATGALAHFLALFTWIVGPGIIYAISPAGSDSRKEAAKSFNFQVVAMLTLIVGGIVSWVILPNWMDNILLPLIWLGWLLGTVVGGAKAAQGEDWTNPATKVTRLRILSEK